MMMMMMMMMMISIYIYRYIIYVDGRYDLCIHAHSPVVNRYGVCFPGYIRDDMKSVNRCVSRREWMGTGVAGIIINSYGSFPRSLGLAPF